MAALMTSVMDNITKVSEYILSCRQMGIAILLRISMKGRADFPCPAEPFAMVFLQLKV